VVLGRELTKTFETFYAGPAGAVSNAIEADPNGARGEFVAISESSILMACQLIRHRVASRQQRC